MSALARCMRCVGEERQEERTQHTTLSANVERHVVGSSRARHNATYEACPMIPSVKRNPQRESHRRSCLP